MYRFFKVLKVFLGQKNNKNRFFNIKHLYSDFLGSYFIKKNLKIKNKLSFLKKLNRLGCVGCFKPAHKSLLFRDPSILGSCAQVFLPLFFLFFYYLFSF
jgi:hypothetical protein